MKKKAAIALLLGLLCMLSISCGKREQAEESQEGDSEIQTDVMEDDIENKGFITVTAVGMPQMEILEQAKRLLKEEGWTLTVTEYSDYETPYRDVEDGKADAAYMGHSLYLNSFNEKNGTHLALAGRIHYEPFGIYAGTQNDFAKIENGSQIAIPSELIDQARALLLLQDNGMIVLRDGVGLSAVVSDITKNPKNLTFLELPMDQIPDSLSENAFGIMSENEALLENPFAVNQALISEDNDCEAVTAYAAILAVKEGNEDTEKICLLREALKSDAIKHFIEKNYDGTVMLCK